MPVFAREHTGVGVYVDTAPHPTPARPPVGKAARRREQYCYWLMLKSKGLTIADVAALVDEPASTVAYGLGVATKHLAGVVEAIERKDALYVPPLRPVFGIRPHVPGQVRSPGEPCTMCDSGRKIDAGSLDVCASCHRVAPAVQSKLSAQLALVRAEDCREAANRRRADARDRAAAAAQRAADKARRRAEAEHRPAPPVIASSPATPSTPPSRDPRL